MTETGREREDVMQFSTRGYGYGLLTVVECSSMDMCGRTSVTDRYVELI